MRYLVTGGTGFLGSHIVRHLILKGEEVVLLKRKFSKINRIADLIGQVHLIDLDRFSVEKIFCDYGRIDVVIHCATCYGRSGENINEIVEADLTFPIFLLEAASKAQVNTFVNTDTVLPKALNAYALAKSQFREWAEYYGEHAIIRILNLKIDHFYGPGDDSSKFTTYVMESCISNREELELTGGEQERDFIYVDDVVSAYFRLLDVVDSKEKSFYEYAIGSGRPVTLRQFVQTVHRLTSSKTILKFGALPYRPNEPMRVDLDVKPLHGLGWTPSYSIEEGIRSTLVEMESKRKLREGQ